MIFLSEDSSVRDYCEDFYQNGRFQLGTIGRRSIMVPNMVSHQGLLVEKTLPIIKSLTFTLEPRTLMSFHLVLLLRQVKGKVKKKFSQVLPFFGSPKEQVRSK